MMVKTPAAANSPQSIPDAETVRVMVAEIGLAATEVSVRGSSNSTQENMKQKNAANPMPLAINGTSILMKNRGNEYPSRKAGSLISRGTADTKPFTNPNASRTIELQ